MCSVCTKNWLVNFIFQTSRGASRTKQGKFTTIENESYNWFLHNFFNTNPILIFCCNNIWFLQSIYRDKCHLCLKPWSITFLFRISIGSSSIKQGKSHVVDNGSHHWFLHNFFNTHPILDCFVVTAPDFYVAAITIHIVFVPKSWLVTVVFQRSRGSSRNIFE